MRRAAKPRAVVVGAATCLLTVVGPAVARAPETGPPVGATWQQWQDLITKDFAHDRVTFASIDRPVFSRGGEGCPLGPFQSPGLWARLTSRAPQVFGNIELAIFATSPGGDVYNYLRDLIDHRVTSDIGAFGIVGSCAFILNAAIAVAQVPGYWVEIHGHCADGGLYSYEVGDVLGMLRERNGGAPLKTVAMTKCGGGLPKFTSVAELTKSLEKPVSYWHRTFPGAREEARKRLLRQSQAQPVP